MFCNQNTFSYQNTQKTIHCSNLFEDDAQVKSVRLTSLEKKDLLRFSSGEASITNKIEKTIINNKMLAYHCKHEIIMRTEIISKKAPFSKCNSTYG